MPTPQKLGKTPKPWQGLVVNTGANGKVLSIREILKEGASAAMRNDNCEQLRKADGSV